MVQYHKPVKKKNSGSGGKKRALRDKRRAHLGGFFARTKYEAPKSAEGAETKEARKEFRVRGGGRKVAAERIFYANLATPGSAAGGSSGGVKKTRVLNVVETPASRHYARENVVVKGAIILTEAGKARVTSRPGQHGVINAVLLKEEKERETEKETVKEKPAAAAVAASEKSAASKTA
ncbi:MAG: 30S ribosomal protein S8e [Candidatus Micrarchaeota archaeon]